MLATRSVTFSHSQQRFQFPDIDLEKGQSCALVGPSGSGKTTLLHLIAGLLTPLSGDIQIVGVDIARLSPAQRDQFRGQQMGIVLQRLHLMSALTVSQNLHLAAKLARCPIPAGRIQQLLQELDIADKADAKPASLSVGQAQRVAIARAVIHQPKLLLADEPTSSLDDTNARRVLTILKDQAERCGAALLVITHDARVKGQLDRSLTISAPEACA